MRYVARHLAMTASFLYLCISGSAARAADEEGPGYEIKVENVKVQPTMSIRFRAAPEDLADNFAKAFGALYGYVMSNGGELVGPPFGRYLNMTEGEFEVEAGLPVAKVLAEKGEIKPSELPGGTVATTMHVGPYEGLGQAHEALENWVHEHGKKATGGPWESYLTDPGSEPDPAKYKTKLYQPIEDEKSSSDS